MANTVPRTFPRPLCVLLLGKGYGKTTTAAKLLGASVDAYGRPLDARSSKIVSKVGAWDEEREKMARTTDVRVHPAEDAFEVDGEDIHLIVVDTPAFTGQATDDRRTALSIQHALHEGQLHVNLVLWFVDTATIADAWSIEHAKTLFTFFDRKMWDHLVVVPHSRTQLAAIDKVMQSACPHGIANRAALLRDFAADRIVTMRLPSITGGAAELRALVLDAHKRRCGGAAALDRLWNDDICVICGLPLAAASSECTSMMHARPTGRESLIDSSGSLDAIGSLRDIVWRNWQYVTSGFYRHPRYSVAATAVLFTLVVIALTQLKGPSTAAAPRGLSSIADAATAPAVTGVRVI